MTHVVFYDGFLFSSWCVLTCRADTSKAALLVRIWQPLIVNRIRGLNNKNVVWRSCLHGRWLLQMQTSGIRCCHHFSHSICPMFFDVHIRSEHYVCPFYPCAWNTLPDVAYRSWPLTIGRARPLGSYQKTTYAHVRKANRSGSQQPVNTARASLLDRERDEGADYMSPWLCSPGVIFKWNYSGMSGNSNFGLAKDLISRWQCWCGFSGWHAHILGSMIRWRYPWGNFSLQPIHSLRGVGTSILIGLNCNVHCGHWAN